MAAIKGNKVVNKSDIVEQIAQKMPHLHKNIVKNVIDSLFNEINNALISGDKVDLRGLGSFKLKKNESKPAKDPRTGVDLVLPARLVPTYTPAIEIKKALAAPKQEKLVYIMDNTIEQFIN